MVFHDVEQQTDQWFQLRCGHIGGSSIGKIMANHGKAFGQPAHDLAVKIAIEQITGNPQESNYTNQHMERGHEQEPIARALYEETFFCRVGNGGFYEDDIYGVSPDGRVDDDGLIEIKSVIYTVHYANIARGSYDPSYKWQLFLELKVSEREWIDFVSFCSTFPEGKRLYTFKLNREECDKEFGLIDERMGQFRELVSEKKRIIEDL